MKRFLLGFATALMSAIAVAAAPAGAAASMIELGVDSGAPLIAPSCPPGATGAACTIVLTQVTAVETVRDGVNYPTTVKQAGLVVAFTVGVSGLSTDPKTVSTIIQNLNTSYGSPMEAQLSVLRPVGKLTLRRYVVAAQSPVENLQPFLGQVVQFPLATPLPVVPGEQIGLTVPTWAPVLSFGLTPAKFGYRQSRDYATKQSAQKPKTDCFSTPLGFAQVNVGASSIFQCTYPGTRVEYSATEITTPVPGG